MSNKNQTSISTSWGGHRFRVVLDRKGIAYPIWEKQLPNRMTAPLVDHVDKTARKMGAKGVATMVHLDRRLP